MRSCERCEVGMLFEPSWHLQDQWWYWPFRIFTVLVACAFNFWLWDMDE